MGPLARVDIRAAGAGEQFGGALNAGRIAGTHVTDPVALGRVDGWHLILVGLLQQQLVSEGQKGGPRPAGHGGPEGGAHHLREALPLADRGGVLGDRPGHALGVGSLPGTAAVRVGEAPRTSGADGHDRMAFTVGAHEAGEHVAGTARRVGDHDAGAARHSRVTLGDVHRCLLVVGVDVPDAVFGVCATIGM